MGIFRAIHSIWVDEGWVGKFMVTLFALMLISIPLAINQHIEEERAWQAFKQANSCVVVGRKEGHTSTGVGYVGGGNGGGVMVTSNRTPDQIGWACEDGVTYWRND